MQVLEAECLMPGRLFDEGQRVSALFLPEGKENAKENQIWVNSKKPQSKEAKYLQSLRKGQSCKLIERGRSKQGNPYYAVLEEPSAENSERYTGNGKPQTKQLKQLAGHLARCFDYATSIWRYVGVSPTTESLQATAASLFIESNRSRIQPDEEIELVPFGDMVLYYDSPHEVGECIHQTNQWIPLLADSVSVGKVVNMALQNMTDRHELQPPETKAIKEFAEFYRDYLTHDHVNLLGNPDPADQDTPFDG